MSSAPATPTTSTADPPPSPKPAVITMADFIGNPAVREMLSFLIAKLELLKYETRSSLFRTSWAKNTFYKSLHDLCPQAAKNAFDVDKWFQLMKVQARSQGQQYIDADMLSADINTNWIDPLLRIEQAIPGFLKLFYSALQLEDMAHTKMGTLVDHNKNGYDEANKCGVHPAITYR